MLVLQYVEQKEKKKVQVIKWGGLLPISSFGSRHYSGVATGKTWCVQQKNARARPCLGRPVTTGLLGCFIATESFLS